MHGGRFLYCIVCIVTSAGHEMTAAIPPEESPACIGVGVGVGVGGNSDIALGLGLTVRYSEVNERVEADGDD